MRERMHGVVAIKRHATGGMVACLAGPEAGIVAGP